ncbi:MAG TPA: hypothetical protein VMU16_11650 [Candidatus Binataceae bacterium]|nr:hypothetical protein [Candidatus Binataceae bacterium]
MIAIKFHGAIRALASIARSISNELHRLNHGRLGDAVLNNAAPRERAKIVKAALARHHRNPNRCC